MHKHAHLFSGSRCGCGSRRGRRSLVLLTGGGLDVGAAALLEFLAALARAGVVAAGLGRLVQVLLRHQLHRRYSAYVCA